MQYIMELRKIYLLKRSKLFQKKNISLQTQNSTYTQRRNDFKVFSISPRYFPIQKGQNFNIWNFTCEQIYILIENHFEWIRWPWTFFFFLSGIMIHDSWIKFLIDYMKYGHLLNISANKMKKNFMNTFFGSKK